MRFRDDTGTVRWAFGIPGSAGATDFFLANAVNGHLPLYIQAGAPSNALYLNASGNVGIGTAAPGQKLSVAGVVESTSGGFKFPDGTTQTTASTGGGGGGTATDLNCTGCVSSSEVNFNYAGSSSKGGAATNALALGGVARKRVCNARVERLRRRPDDHGKSHRFGQSDHLGESDPYRNSERMASSSRTRPIRARSSAHPAPHA